MSTDTLPEHLQRPALRRIHPVPVEGEVADQQGNRQKATFLGLRDPFMLSPQMMVIPPQALSAVQLFDGQRTIAEVASALKLPDPAPLMQLVAKLDEFGLIWGPTCEALEGKKRVELESVGAFPAGATRALGEDPAAVRAQLEKWIDEAEDAGIDEPVAGIVSCHLDFARGHPIYAASFRVVAKGPRPDRVVILGPGHFGLGDGVTVAHLGFESPLGRVRADQGILGRLKASTGDRLFKDSLDHLPEHSLQLQLPWIQHLFGDVPVVAAIVPDPNAPMIADDGARLNPAQFASALGEALAAEGGRTLFVASADLSHAGPAFGDQAAVDEAQRRGIEARDRELLRAYISGATAMTSALKSTGNATRWSSAGALFVASTVAAPSSVELIDYRQSVDEQGMALVSAASLALLA
ncbi:MAG: AmmeMemoRadiSam system protein B [bacterium]